MSLDTRLWEALEAHGVTNAHLDMLLRALDLHRTGSLAWHFAPSGLTQVDLRLVAPSRRVEVGQVSDALLREGNSLLR